MKYLSFIATLLLFQVQLFSQVTITGTVTDGTNGETMPGATVSAEGTMIGTITDINGYYSLTVPDDAGVLVVSHIGYETQRIVIGDKTEINLTMNLDSEELEEVVVTALGIKREKKSLGYAVQEVSGDEMSESDPQNIVSALSGRIAGAQITTSSGQLGASTTIKIRGNKSFDGTSQPLFVVDGTPLMNSTSSARSSTTYTDFGNAAMDIDPANIESVSVLKGASATALYGSRGANGVVLITTKKGSAQNGLGIQFSTSYAFDEVYILPNYQNDYGQGFNGSEYAFEAFKELANRPEMTYQEYHDIKGFSWATDGSGKSMDADESWGSRLDVGLMVPQFDSPLDADGNPTATPWISRPDNVKNYYDIGLSSVSNLSMTNQTDRSSGRFSIGFADQKGVSPNTDQTKINLGLNTSIDLSDKLKVDLNINYVKLNNDNLPQQGNSMRNPLLEFNSWFGRQVNLEYMKEHYNDIIMYNGEPTAYNWMMDYPSQHPNPYWNAYKNTMSRGRDRVFGNAAISYNLFEGVDIVGKVGTDFFNESRKYIHHQYSRDWTDLYENAINGNMWEEIRLESETNADLMLKVNRNLTDDISLFATFGGNYRQSYDQYATTHGFDLVVPDFFSTSNYKGDYYVSFSKYKKVTNSLYGTANFGFRKYLFLDLTLRSDWSSVLPAENRNYTYPSVNLGFIFTDALDIKSDIFNYGKLRGGYAVVGDDNIGPYQTSGVFVPYGTAFNGVDMFRGATVLPSPDLKPEMTYSYELGGEFKFFQNRLGFDLTYYDATTKNQLINVDISPSTGFSAWTKNAGNIRNHGIEIEAYGTIVEAGDFNWDVNMNWSKNNNMVVSLSDSLNELQIANYNMSGGADVTLMAFPGQEWGAIYGTTFERNDNGDILVNRKGMPYEAADPEVLGYVNPDWVGGIRNSFSFKGISLSVLIDFRKGGDVFSFTKGVGQKTGILQSTVEGGIRETGMIVPGVYEEGVSLDLDEDGTREDVSGLTNETVIDPQRYFSDSRVWSELSIIDGSFIKLREVVLNYRLPYSWTNKIGLQNASLSLFGRNLALLYTHESNDVHIDPEVSTGGTLSGTGLEMYQTPPTRTIGLKLNVKF